MASKPNTAAFPSWLAAEERKADRIPVDWPASWASAKFAEEDAHVCDITNLGCRLRTARNVGVGTFVTVKMPGVAEAPGWIAWTGPNEVGVDFSHPLPAAVIEDIARRHFIGL